MEVVHYIYLLGMMVFRGYWVRPISCVYECIYILLKASDWTLFEDETAQDLDGHVMAPVSINFLVEFC